MSVLATAAEIASFLDDLAIPYAIIGGLAVQYWGEPRTTRDVDVVVLVSPDRMKAFLDAAVESFRPRLSDAVSFALTNRTLLISGADSTPVDISLGLPGYEEEALSRAVTVELSDNNPVRLISAEDLVIHKCIAGRPRDLEDVETVVARQKLSLDADYVRQWLRQFAELMEDPNITGIFEAAFERAKAERSDSEGPL